MPNKSTHHSAPAVPHPIDPSHADPVNLGKAREVFEQYGAVVPMSDGSMHIVLPKNDSDLAAKMSKFLEDPKGAYKHHDKDGDYRNNARDEEIAALSAATGGPKTPDIALNSQRDERGRVSLGITKDTLDTYTKPEIQEAFNLMLDALQVPKKIGSLEQLPKEVISAARTAASIQLASGDHPPGAEPNGDQIVGKAVRITSRAEGRGF